MNALQALPYAKGPFHLVVVNNCGGKIFAPMFKDKMFENRHEMNFKNIADMFNLNYFCLDKNDFSKIDLNSCSLIEICPNSGQTEDFQNEYNLIQQGNCSPFTLPSRS